jgi:hypothetical protein
VFDGESGGIFRHLCPSRSIENEQPNVCHQILRVRPNASTEPRAAGDMIAQTLARRLQLELGSSLV